MERVIAERALLVEDHDLLAQMMTRALNFEGVEVDRAPSGSLADVLGAVDQGGYSLVVLDADRAGADGDVQKLITGLHAPGRVVVVLTDSADVGKSARNGGASCVVAPNQGANAWRTVLGLEAAGS